ncbi:type VI secretion system protein TssA [Pseudomonas sp. GD03860]|uniref:type VI secretion system protein TssA n=1 Tax=Pseudomonas TaxID=286 RepID=UPI00236492D9|nr:MULTISPECIES: type VI secretion system protein TssA [Pseudomonas]MDD2058601.1 type VI secretion system protein TssA [Pseudomonas putida]MDH0639534.1 type VI secretion system protein TssA [Pseudomonas sp. GD03860]
MIDISLFIDELAARECGDNLEYDADFLELFRQATEQQDTQYGEHIYTPEPIEWRVVELLCLKLFERTQDLRVAACLVRAWLEREGLPGLIGGLRVLRYLLQERWETVHPQLDPLDQFDPIMRINALAELAVPGGVSSTLGREVLACAPGSEPFSVADLAVIAAGGESSQRAECLLRLGSLVEPGCSTELESSLGVLDQVKTLLLDIGHSLDAHTGLFSVSPLQPLALQMTTWVEVLEARVGGRKPAQSSGTQEHPRDGRQGAEPAEGVPGECHSREQVLRALEAVERYYGHYEPSSPVPVLLQRVQRLAMMDFMQIIAELTPSSIEEVRQLAGIKND